MQVHRCNVVESEGDAVIVCQVSIMKCVECRLHVTNCRPSAIGRQEGVYGCKIRSSGCGKLSDAANKLSRFVRKPL